LRIGATHSSLVEGDRVQIDFRDIKEKCRRHGTIQARGNGTRIKWTQQQKKAWAACWTAHAGC
jgi:hypothetical protein